MNTQQCNKKMILNNRESLLLFFKESKNMEELASHLLICDSCFRSALKVVNHFIDDDGDETIAEMIEEVEQDRQTPFVRVANKIIDTRLKENYHWTEADSADLSQRIRNSIAKEPSLVNEGRGVAPTLNDHQTIAIKTNAQVKEEHENILIEAVSAGKMGFRNLQEVHEETRKEVELGSLLKRVFASQMLMKTEANQVFEILNNAGHTLSKIVDELLGFDLFKKDAKHKPFDLLEVAQYQLEEARNEEWLDMTTDRWRDLGVEKQISYATAYQQWYAEQKEEPLERRFPLGTLEMKMVLIPPGKYWMGSLDDKTRHEVVISQPFCCGKYPVTQKQYEAVIGTNPSHFKGDTSCPVENVSWDDCQMFCEKTGIQLLSEAQWEYACRAGTTTTYSFGEDPKHLELYAWYLENSAGKTHPVGEKLGNAFGLKDMLGNVREWCKDLYSASASGRVRRGGSWDISASSCTSADRDWGGPSDRDFYLGFRVVRSYP